MSLSAAESRTLKEQTARVRRWAEALMALHLPDGWSFRIDHARRRAGLCNYTDQVISLSKHLLLTAEDDEIHQVLLHEVAHAIAGAEAGHGMKWKKIAAELGYEGGRLHHHELAAKQAPWQGHCPAGHEHHRFRKPSRPMSCAKCSPRFTASAIITWRRQ